MSPNSNNVFVCISKNTIQVKDNNINNNKYIIAVQMGVVIIHANVLSEIITLVASIPSHTNKIFTTHFYLFPFVKFKLYGKKIQMFLNFVKYYIRVIP